MIRIEHTGSLSEAQESAQLLGGADLVVEVMRSLMDGSSLQSADTLHVLNMTPYEGCFEYAMKTHS